MDGLLVIGLILWVISKMSKSNKKSKPAPGAKRTIENTAQRRAERLSKMNAELEKRREQLAKERQQTEQKPAFSEGGSVLQPVNAEFRGSLPLESTEGECLCEPELEHQREPEPAPGSVYAGEIGREPLVDFSPRGVLQGIVMNEILTRPAQRSRRR